MEVIIRINTDTKTATLETYKDGNKVEVVEDIKQLTFENFSDNNNIMPAANFMIAGTALKHSENGEIKLQRFMNKDNPRYATIKANTGGKTRTHPNDNGNRLNGEAEEQVPHKDEENSSGVLGFMDDIVIRQQPRGRN